MVLVARSFVVRTSPPYISSRTKNFAVRTLQVGVVGELGVVEQHLLRLAPGRRVCQAGHAVEDVVENSNVALAQRLRFFLSTKNAKTFINESYHTLAASKQDNRKKANIKKASSCEQIT